MVKVTSTAAEIAEDLVYMHGRIVFICFAAVSLVSAQSTDPHGAYLQRAKVTLEIGHIHAIANGPRPLVQVLDAIKEGYGWQVNYEDPVYASKPDVFETYPQYSTERSGGKIRIVNGGAFTVDAPSSGPFLDREKTLRTVVDSYNASGNPGRFELRRGTEGVFEVVGIGARNDSGVVVPQKAVLDSLIVLPQEQRSTIETLQLICKKVGDRSQAELNLGIYPMNLMRITNATIGGSQYQARTLLERTLNSTGRTISYRMLYDPESKNYVINFSIVQPVLSTAK
jgi:hypothetical protein